MGSLPQGREPIDNNVLKIAAELTEAVMSRDIDRINEMSAAYVAALKNSKNKKGERVMDELFKDLLESSFMCGVIVYRIKEDIYTIRSELDRLHIADRTHSGLTKSQQEDMDELWKDLEGLMRTYMYYSGDYDLDDLDSWE